MNYDFEIFSTLMIIPPLTKQSMAIFFRFIFRFMYNDTQNNICWCGIIIGHRHRRHHTGSHYNLSSSRQPRKLISVCNLILTQLNEIWKTTSIFSKMEEDLIFLLIEDYLNYFQIEGNLNILVNWRKHHFFPNGRWPHYSC